MEKATNEINVPIKEFSFNTIQDFDNHILTSIPCYKDIYENVKKFSEYFIQENSNVYDIGCSTGKLLKDLPKKHGVKKIGIDVSLNLLPENRTNDISFVNLDLKEEFIFNNASLITSLFTIQFLPLSCRQDLLNRIYRGLNKGGGFIFCEKIFSNDTKIQDIFTFNYYDYKKQTFNYDTILAKEKDLRKIMFPMTHEDNVEMLRQAGFRKYDIFIKYFNFEGILAIK